VPVPAGSTWRIANVGAGEATVIAVEAIAAAGGAAGGRTSAVLVAG
jgi:hypothetical protein